MLCMYMFQRALFHYMTCSRFSNMPVSYVKYSILEVQYVGAIEIFARRLLLNDILKFYPSSYPFLCCSLQTVILQYSRKQMFSLNQFLAGSSCSAKAKQGKTTLSKLAEMPKNRHL